MINVLIVDDQVLLRESLQFIIEQDAELKVVGCAGNGNEALQLCEKLAPDVVLMDIVMPVCDGIEGTRLIKAKCPAVKIMILSTFGDDKNIVAALKCGANGYILKDIKPDELIQAIKHMAAGMPMLHPQALKAIVKQMSSGEPPGGKKMNEKVNLTEREIKIIRLIVEGRSNKEIAEELHFSEGSVKNFVTEILEKLQLKDRTQLAVYAVKNKLV